MTAEHPAKFGWPPLSDVTAVTKPKRKTRWNLLGCPKLSNRSQPLLDRRSPYCEDLWTRYCCLTSFYRLYRYLPKLRRYSMAKLCDGARMAIFCVFLSPAFPASRVPNTFSDLHCKFTLTSHHCVEVWFTSNLRPLRIGEEKIRKDKEDRRNYRSKIECPNLLRRAARNSFVLLEHSAHNVWCSFVM